MLNAKLIVPGDFFDTLHFCVDHFITLYREAIARRDLFAVALSGGSTPKAIYELLCSYPYQIEINWNKVHLFWSDERAVPPTHSESNFHMAMKAGFEQLPILPQHIHRMIAETNIEKNALLYEKTIRSLLEGGSFDLVMLGVGQDGHTASLFPETEGLNAINRLVVANYIPFLKSWRMTLTLECINDAHQTVFYVLGSSKAALIQTVFASSPERQLPCQYVGTVDRPSLWIADTEAAAFQLKSKP